MDATPPALMPGQPGVAVSAPPAISTQNLTKRYGALCALDSLNLELAAGDVFGFIGPNGAGKSTTMKILAGLLEPSSGSAMVMGKAVAGNGDFVRRQVGYMPDFIGVYEDLKVSEYLEFFASAYAIPRKQRKSTVEQVLELTDLKYKRDALVDSLSRGMTQRLSLARVLIHDPPVLLLDEPASGLDPRARIEIRELLKELQRLGKTILISSHILSELGEFCNKLGIIERGKMIVQGTVEELMDRARAHPIISVTIMGDAERAIGVLKSDGRVDRAELAAPVPGSMPAPGTTTLSVVLHDPDQHHGFLAERLVAGGISIDSIHPEKLKLEDVFLRLTKGMVQ
ncbi:ABC transporter ATP-binding protein [Humisphaera borealis]|nr:ABC transporter ATP-binding protein [Humisphaera borealis]